MISVPRLRQVLQTLSGGRQQRSDGQHEPTTTKHNMVASSRSSRGRPNLRSDGEQQSVSSNSSPITATATATANHRDAPSPRPHQDDASSSRAKRNRITSVSDHESLQKRRRLSRSSGLPQVHIPLRGRAVPQSLTHDVTRNGADNITTSYSVPQPPALVTQDSSISNSPLNSPHYRPQYDQFKRIEEKAQKVVKKNIRDDAAKDDKRKLRSEHGSTRSKTELAQYFPAFDDMLSLAPADPSLFTAKTPVVLVDDTPTFEPPPPQPDYFRNLQPPHNSEVIDLEQYAAPSKSHEDPLADSVYLKAHQKAERHEKQMKNGDKERAQHEKYQLERLLEELQGPDWLKTLGISGITDTEKKRYEVKRALFIRETKALIDKFRRWKEEEKRRKLEKQQHLLEEMEADDDQASSSTVRKRPRKSRTNSRNRSRANSQPVSASASVDHAPDSSELDALASQQLLEEAKLANMQRKKLLAQDSLRSHLPFLPEVFTKPFTSFFQKRHIRDAAVSGRNRGRKIYAFGQEVPELEDRDFELPWTILTEDAIKTSQRNRRRRMRSIDDG